MIDKKEFTDEIIRVFSLNGMQQLLDGDKCDRFYRLTERMLIENEKYNLTAITDTKKIILNHYADCATLASRIDRSANVADIGCGAGFPSLPLAILRPDVKIFAVDSTAKRIGYVNETARLLGLDNVTAVTMRAEEGALMPKYREAFDVVTARAVAPMPILSELCLPYVKPMGKFIAMKGRQAEDELKTARAGIKALGGGEAYVEEISLLGGEDILTHPLITIKKVNATPKSYPRPYAKILKKPL